jgi:hypothetical protein
VGEFLPTDEGSAAGDPDGDGRASHTLVETSDGDGWHVASSPDGGEGGAVLSGVSCPASNRCVAVGYYRPAEFPLDAASAPPDYPLLETYDGRLWQLATGPRVPPNSILTGISCPNVTECVAVGSTTRDVGNARTEESPFAESLDGETWSALPLASSPGTSGALTSVSCSSASTCVAVGSQAPHDDPSATMPLIETFERTSWMRAAVPTAVAGRGVLYDVACVPNGPCVAVGSTEAQRNAGALVLSSSGMTWRLDAAAMATRGDLSLTTVACADATSCFVAGTSLASLGASPEEIVARVGATTWMKLGVVPSSAIIDAIACGTTWGCLLVGSRTSDSLGNTTAVVASLAGGIWTIEPTPTP